MAAGVLLGQASLRHDACTVPRASRRVAANRGVGCHPDAIRCAEGGHDAPRKWTDTLSLTGRRIQRDQPGAGEDCAFILAASPEENLVASIGHKMGHIAGGEHRGMKHSCLFGPGKKANDAPQTEFLLSRGVSEGYPKGIALRLDRCDQGVAHFKAIPFG